MTRLPGSSKDPVHRFARLIRALAVGFILSGSAFGVGVCGDGLPPAVWIAGGRALAYFSAANPELRILKLGERSSELLLSHEALAKLQGSDEPCSASSGWQLIASQKSAGWLVLANAQRIVSLDLTTRRLRVLLSSRRPMTEIEISPDGARISFLRDGKVELLDRKSGSVQPLVPGAKDGTSVGAIGPAMRNQFQMTAGYWWAPDSSRIAYLQSEMVGTQQARAGQPLPLPTLWLCNIRKGVRRQIDLGNLKDRYLSLVQWFPDSRRLLAGVLNREQTSLSLFVADSSPKRPALLFEERDPYWVNMGVDFRLLGDAQYLLWSSERSGYRHFQLYDFQTHLSHPLTAGKWEVTDLSYVNEQVRQVYFTGTLSGPTERALYRIPLEGGPPVRISSLSGTHAVSFSPKGAAYLDTFSDLRTLPTRSVRRADGTLLFSLESAEQRQARKIPPEVLTIRTHDNARLDAMLVRPPGLDRARKYPVIIEW